MKLPALILNDYPDAPYAEWVKTGRKKIETRMGRKFSHRGDLVICCGWTNSVGQNRGKALCIVDLYKVRRMLNRKEETAAAQVEFDPRRYCHFLRDWRHFSEEFYFKSRATKRNFQGVFEIEVPDDIEIIPRPDIKPYQDFI